MSDVVTLVECPRDAMQGWSKPIPVGTKIAYINQLLKVGFHTIDFGSFVSPKAIPQMADTKEVLSRLDVGNSSTKLLAIIANIRGAEDAVLYEQIHYLGFPFSLSQTFQRRNTHSTIEQSFETVKVIRELCSQSNKKLVVYISMAFGNPYGDPHEPEFATTWIRRLVEEGIETISLADTVGIASPGQVSEMTSAVLAGFPSTTVGVHLHSTLHNWKEKVDAAFNAGCRRFDGALRGVGGCPMANDALVGNMATDLMIDYFRSKHVAPGLNEEALQVSMKMADEIFKN